jgi:hypothetical protein
MDGADGVPGPGASGAPPTALLGLTAITGTRDAYTRADGAPALDQSIAPVWTGSHKNTHVIAARGTAGDYPIFVSSAVPYIAWDASGQAANARVWEISVSGLQFFMRPQNDAGTVGNAFLAANRSAGSSAVASVAFGNATDNPTYAFNGTGVTTHNGPITLVAGTTALVPYKFLSGTNLTTAVAGAQEYDGTVKYFSPAASSRAVDLAEYVQILNAAYTLTSQTAAQKLLNGTTNGAVTLPIGTYFFECEFSLTAMSAVSGSFGFAFGGAATFTQAWWAIADMPAALTTATAPQMTFDTAANTTLATAATSTIGYAKISGVLRVTVAGTVIPQVSLTQAAAAIVGINSFFRCRPIGNGTVVSVGNWS